MAESESTTRIRAEQAAARALRPVGAACRKAVARAADILLPPLCLGCRESVYGHGGLCAACWTGIDFIEPPLCNRLGVPLPYPVGEPVVSAAALADPPVYDRARAVARYDGTMRGLVHALKYRDRHEGVRLFAGWLAHAGRDLIGGAEVIVPVPLYRLRLWTRRFNQAALLAGALSRRTGVPADPFVLQRVRRTANQVGLSVDQRRRNVAGAFRVAPAYRGAMEDRVVLLVDDVITTGATADACARTLKRVGAARVDVLALARVVDPLAPGV